MEEPPGEKSWWLPCGYRIAARKPVVHSSPRHDELTLIVLVPLPLVSARLASTERRIVCTTQAPLALTRSSAGMTRQQSRSLVTLSHSLPLHQPKRIRLPLPAAPLIPLIPLMSRQCKRALTPPARCAAGWPGKVEARYRPRAFNLPVLFLLRRTCSRGRFQPGTR